MPNRTGFCTGKGSCLKGGQKQVSQNVLYNDSNNILNLFNKKFKCWKEPDNSCWLEPNGDPWFLP